MCGKATERISMKKKIAVVFVLAVMSAALLAGCSESKNSLSIKGQNTREETEEKQDTEDEAESRAERKTEKKSENGDTFTYHGDDFSITFPNTWTDVSSAMASAIGADAVFAHYGTASNGYAENMNVIVQDLGGYNMDLDKYTELSKAQYEAMDGYEIIGINDGTINGTEIRKVEVDAAQNGIKCYCMQVFAVENEKAYIFTFSSDYEDKDSLMGEVELIFNSIIIE